MPRGNGTGATIAGVKGFDCTFVCEACCEQVAAADFQDRTKEGLESVKIQHEAHYLMRLWLVGSEEDGKGGEERRTCRVCRPTVGPLAERSWLSRTGGTAAVPKARL